ncbi:MAG TPA: transporter substrate-binding protein [Candidatus Baltobacteraceae bacterium]|jgi:urea transport system substrate-binding protein|nr:transporter substrate-binding protein [Candidatus Baltobacteraceae bacterium]
MNETLDSRRLKAFAVLAKTESHTETARQLNLTPSAISHAMRELEEDVGCRLFIKMGKKIVLTEAGEALLYHALRALGELDQARRALIYLNKWGTRRLRVAADAIFLSIFLAPVLSKFHKEYPNILLQVESFNSDESFSLLENNHVDVILTEKPAINDAVDFFPLMTDRFHLIAKSGHPLAVKNGALRDEFGKYPCFLIKDSGQARKQVEEFMLKQKINLNILGEIENLGIIKELVNSTLALSFLPGWSIAKELENHSLVALPYGRRVFERTWGLVYSRSRPLNLTESDLLKLCRKRVMEPELKAQYTVKVGVLHSLSGTMAISETSLRDVLLFAFDEINNTGGIEVAGKLYKIDPVIVDGASNWSLFAEKAKELLVEDKVAVTFGCWTSVSRKSVKPVFEKENGLLFYPVQYEGEELSKNIFYIAETVNQQAIPAVDYLLAQGKKKFYLIGTDYVYPQTTNMILYKYLLLHGVPPEFIGGGFWKENSGKVISAGKYVPFGYTDFQQIVADIKEFAASGNACVINTINGDSNVPFFNEIADAGLTPAACPMVSFSLAEDELRSMPTKKLAGELGCWSYFMSLKTPGNKTFLKSWYSWLKTESYPGVIREKRAVDSPIVLSYSGVYLWKRAVEKAGTFDVDAVRNVLESGDISFEGPGGKITVQANHHCTKNVYIGETQVNGQFKILETFPQVVGEPFVADPFLLKSFDEKLSAENL